MKHNIPETLQPKRSKDGENFDINGERTDVQQKYFSQSTEPKIPLLIRKAKTCKKISEKEILIK